MTGVFFAAPPAPSEGDKILCASENFLAAAEKNETNLLRRLTGHSVEFQFRKPRDIFKRNVPQPFLLSEVPTPIATFAHAFAAATGFDHSGIIVAATTAAAAVIDDRYKLAVRPRSNWVVSARQWSFLCTDPSGGKSPILRAATDPVKQLHGALFAQWKLACSGVDEKARPPIPALFSSDATVAALSERLKDNPRGLFVLNEEFSSWVGAIDSGDKSDAAKNRGDWLQLRDGGARQIDRIGRGSVLVPNWGASVLAACTPEGLRKQMKNMPEDGLIQRFVPCIMGVPDLDADGDCSDAMSTWGQWLRWAYEFTTRTQDEVSVHLSPDAARYFDNERKEQRQLAIATAEFSPPYASHLGKHPGMLAEIALIFHVFAARGIPGTELDAQTMITAIQYMRRVRRHAYAMYTSILSGSPSYDLAQALGRSIVASDEVTTRIGRDWMTTHCALFKKADDRTRREAVQILEDADWLEASVGERAYGGWPRSFNVNDKVFSIFSREGEQWRARRAAVRDAIGGDD